MFVRWLPLAASLVLFVGAAALFLLGGMRLAAVRFQESASARQEAVLTDQLDRALQGLARAQEDRAAAERERDDLSRRLAEAGEAPTELASLRQKLADLEAEAAGLRAKAPQREAAIVQLREEVERRLTERFAMQAEMEKKLAEQRQELESRLAQTEERAKGFHDMVKRAEDERDAARQEVRRLTDAWAAAESHHAAVLDFLAAERRDESPPGRHAAALRVQRCQQLLRDAALLKRYRAAWSDPPDGSVADLGGALEVVLMQLAMLDAADAAARDRFAQLVQRTGALPRIGHALAADGLSPHLRTWLLECRVVLAEVCDAA